MTSYLLLLLPIASRPWWLCLYLMDVAFVAISGLALLLGATLVNDFLGLDATVAIAFGGLLFLPYASWMYWESRRAEIQRRDLIVPMVLNDIWVLATAVVLVSGIPDLTRGGRWAVALVAGAVGVIGMVQWAALRQMRSMPVDSVASRTRSVSTAYGVAEDAHMAATPARFVDFTFITRTPRGYVEVQIHVRWLGGRSEGAGGGCGGVV